MYNYYGPAQKQQKVKQPNLAQIIYLGELPRDVDQYELDQFIKSKGDFDIESLTVKPTKENKSFAYVKFKNKSQADEALKKLHLCSIKDHIIRTEPFKSKEKTDLPKDNSTNIFVKNLPPETTSKELYDLFSIYGNINSIKLKQKEDNLCLGYGYVDFENADNARNAIENLNGSDFKNKKIVVTNFLSKKKKPEDEKFPLVTVKNIPEYLQDSNNLKQFLMKYGDISVCSVINSSLNKNGIFEDEMSKINNQKPELIGLALFDSKQNALSAIKDLNGKILDSNMKPFYIALSPINKFVMDKLLKAKNENFKEKYQGCNLVVKNLIKEIKDKHLYELFRTFGEIKTARIATEGVMKDKKDENGNIIDKEFIYESKGFGFVLFKNSEDASRAIEEMNNKTLEFNGFKLKPSIEYYDYSKSKNTENQNPSNQMNKKFNPQKNQNINNNQNQRNHHLEMNQNQYMNQRYLNNQFPQNDMINQRNEFQQQFYQQNQNMMSRNEISNQMTNIQYQQNRLKSNNMIQMQSKNPVHLQQSTTNKEVVEFIKNINKILSLPHTEERTEQLGEVIFYFLHEFIPKYNLNVIPNLDDTVLCSKLTGILINEDDNEILEIVSTNESIIMFIKNVVLKLINKNEGN